MGKKTKVCDALREKIVKLKVRLATLRGALKVNEEKVKRIDLKVALSAMAFMFLATLVKNQCWNCCLVTAENVKLRRQTHAPERKICEMVSFVV